MLEEVHKGQGHLTFPYFAVKNGLLYQVNKSGEDVQEQLLVHKSHRSTVLHLTHTHLLGARLGVDKEDFAAFFFFWPSIYKEVENYCRSCPECQQVASKPTA